MSMTHVWLYNADTDAMWQCPTDYVSTAKRRGWEDSDGPVDPDADEAVDVPEVAPVEDADVQTAFDPADHSIGEVKEYLNLYRENSPGEVERVISMERAGKNRKTITGD